MELWRPLLFAFLPVEVVLGVVVGVAASLSVFGVGDVAVACALFMLCCLLLVSCW